MEKVLSVDERVQKLIDVVAEQESRIKNVGKFSPETNLQFVQFDKTNLNIINDPIELIRILSWVKQDKANYELIAKEYEKEYNVKLPYKLLGYTFEQWEKDIKHKIDKTFLTQLKESVRVKKEKINKVLTPEQQRLIEIQNLEKELL